jgi:hypothetical protein
MGTRHAHGERDTDHHGTVPQREQRAAVAGKGAAAALVGARQAIDGGQVIRIEAMSQSQQKYESA